MPRQTVISVERDFKGGLVTEATGLNYPDNACVETYDCVFNLLGDVERRKGFDFEFNYVGTAIDPSLSVITTYMWDDVNGDGQFSFLVSQVGDNLYFYNIKDTQSISAGIKSTVFDLTDYSSGGPPPRLSSCQFSDGFGKLIVVHPFLDTFYITYDPVGDTFTGHDILITIRDLKGVVDTEADTSRPSDTTSTISKEHEYNLYNQGWDPTKLAAWDTARTDMPSNCDVWWYYKDTSDAFDASLVASTTITNTNAPKGHYVLDVYNQTRATASGIAGIPDVTTGSARASVTTFFASRAWYTGIAADGFSNNIYFSQVLERDDQIGRCYQVNDPTSSIFFDEQPTDGGVINIPEVGVIYKLFPMQSVLVVFASRGVWTITGSQGTGFTANDYSINKISSVKSLSPSSFVDVNGTPMFWNVDGIYTIVVKSVESGQTALTVTPMTHNNIHTFFIEIPHVNKPYAKGAFDPLTQTVQWAYRSTLPVTVEDNYTFDRILIFDSKTGAFFPWTISDSDVKVHAVFVAESLGGQLIEFDVVDSLGNFVVDEDGNQVVAFQQSRLAIIPNYKYLVSYPDGSDTKFTLADTLSADNFVDWFTYDDTGIDYDSYFITGYKIRGDASKRFQADYVTFYNKDNGTYSVQGVWDYALSGNSGKFTNKQTLVYNDQDFSNLRKRLKIRGSGRTLQLKISSVGGEPFDVIGWSSVQSVNQLT